MNKQETLTWQSGASDDIPAPPLVDLRDLVDRDQLFLRQYRKLGPVFRIPRPDKPPLTVLVGPEATGLDRDRKSTRLNSSHQIISYAVFCLKKKRIRTDTYTQ